MKKALAAMVAAVLAAGCATRPTRIDPAEVDSAPYERLSCEELDQSWDRAYSKLQVVSAQQDSTADIDTIGVIFILLPLGSIFGGDKDGEVASQKGILEAIEVARDKNGC